MKNLRFKKGSGTVVRSTLRAVPATVPDPFLNLKLFGQLLVWGSLAVAALAAATGYLASLEADDEMLIDLTLAAPAGKIDRSEGDAEPIAQPIAKKNQKITAQLLAELRRAGVRNIRVKEFNVRRWRGKWFFLVAVAGLLLGGFLTRAGGRPRSVSQTAEGRTDSPHYTLKAMRTAIDALKTELAGMPDRSRRLDAVVRQVGEVQKTHVTAFVEARAELISMLGLAGYAALMDSFAAAERKLNRAWSAAVDKASEEAFACLDEAASLLDAAQEKLDGPDKARTTRLGAASTDE